MPVALSAKPRATGKNLPARKDNREHSRPTPREGQESRIRRPTDGGGPVIIRNPNRERYVIISKVGLEDERLSWKARGLLAYLLSKPDNWTVLVAHLVKQSPDGRASVRSGLMELREAGYITSERSRDDDGQFDGWETQVFEEPVTEVRLPDVGKPDVRKPNTNEQRTQMNNEPSETLLVTNEVDDRASRFDEQFDELWSHYPRKVGKAAAKKAARIRLSAVPFDELMNATMNYAALRSGQDPAFTMHPATFYGPAERWRDFVDGAPELDIARKARPKSREQVESDIEAAMLFLRQLFDVPRETIERPVADPLIESLLTHHPLGIIGRMPSAEVRAMVTAAAWDRANPKTR